MGKCALIVDDSRTSRVVLGRILETYDLAVDTAESAESALDYLIDNCPDVIFMDHMMPGMDGLQAVETIKRDPKTAMIPIMMYTSQKGEVYLGQARALGAVGVLPKDVEPVEVSKVLEALHIIGEPPVAPADEQPPEIALHETGSFQSLDNGMRLMLENLFDQQRVILKRDLSKAVDAIAKRIAAELEPENRAAEGSEKAAADRASIWAIAAGLLSIVTVVLGTMYMLLHDRWEQALIENESLAGSLKQIESDVTNRQRLLQNELVSQQATTDTLSNAAIAAIEWGFNRSGAYAFGQDPLGDYRIAEFQELSHHLNGVGFSGEIIVETHVGEHCLVLTTEGYALAPPGLAAADCDARSLSHEEAMVMSQRQSVMMADFLLAEELRSGGQLRFVVAPQGISSPLQAYPLLSEGVTAGAWNRIADGNSRIQITLLPDS